MWYCQILRNMSLARSQLLQRMKYAIQSKCVTRMQTERSIEEAIAEAPVALFPVWVGSLNEHVTEKDLRKHFSKFGEIASVKLKTDNATGKSLGFGWVNFCARGNAESAAAKMSLCFACAFH